jgi:hypothetical protein
VSREGSKREREEKGRSTSDEIGLSDVALHRHQVMRLPHESYQCTWCDFLMSRVNRTDVTQMNHILKINFGLVHFLIFLKRVKIKKISEQREPGEELAEAEKRRLGGGMSLFCLLAASLVVEMLRYSQRQAAPKAACLLKAQRKCKSRQTVQ